ncbi:hypothetical protein NDU88_005513 [Pleurodeles waltl]|uniref:Uncharacterized protein n=1 Tax=Pleurodeles waltl TaxID=8319 RepID=A0AAV7UK99_PLEWA|nr:hypothetical protein NDU88_005513 [Pleurodeles waltl]
MITDSFGGAAVFLGRCAARLLEGRRAARCVAGGAARRAARLAATRALQGWPLPCLLFTGCSGATALCGWLLMAPKITKAPRMLRGKSSLEAIGAKREKKQPALPLKDQTDVRGKGAVGNAVQVPAIFTQTAKTKWTPPQKEVCIAQSGTLDDNGDQTFSTGKGTRGTVSLDKTALETEDKATAVQTAMQGQQISDIQWKLEDAENRQRRNSLRILGLAEGLEGQDTRTYVVSLFKKAFPDLLEWNWETEIQKAH